MSDATRTLLEETTDFVEQAKTKVTHTKKPWEVWLQAEWGLRNYWYPAGLSRHVGEGGSKHIILLGEEILLTRQNGVLYAVENRCPHRGTRFSSRPLFYTKETIPCWYHTWTFDLETGELRTILNEPGSKMIGKCSIKSYPVTEQKGIVFVFVGDVEPPPVHYDAAPGLLDENAAVYAA